MLALVRCATTRAYLYLLLHDMYVTGFGYRAAYIAKSAQLLLEFGGEAWLKELKYSTYASAKSALIRLPGIGPKVFNVRFFSRSFSAHYFFF